MGFYVTVQQTRPTRMPMAHRNIILGSPSSPHLLRGPERNPRGFFWAQRLRDRRPKQAIQRRSLDYNPGLAFFAGRSTKSRGRCHVDRQLLDKPVSSSHAINITTNRFLAESTAKQVSFHATSG